MSPTAVGRPASLPVAFLTITLAISACGPATSTPSASPGSATNQANSARTLVFIGRVEPAHLIPKVQVSGSGAASGTTKRLFNATLAVTDEAETPHPYLAEQLPQLNTDTWQVSADGRMVTTYRLAPNLTWHDGSPLEAEDFVFAWRVYSDPDTGGFTPAPQNLIQSVAAPDARTVVIHWKQAYPDAGQLGTEFPPLPRQILEPVFREQRGDVFLGHAFFTREYVGAGPYRLTRWESGAFLEGEAFPAHVSGRPKIDHVRVQFVGDPNTAIANLLAAAAQVAADESIRFQQALTLRREWAASNAGTIILNPEQVRYIQVQLRPEFANPKSVLQVPVRQALAYATDRQALVDGLLEGQGRGADSLLSPRVDFFSAVDQAVKKYPYDIGQTERALRSAGLEKGPDGLYANSGEPFRPELRTIAGTQEEQELAILEQSWRTAGIDVKTYVLPVAQSQDGQTLASFPAFATATSGGVTGTDQLLKKLAGLNAPNPDNRWRGSNLGGWADPEYDRLYDAFSSSLDRTQRNQVIVQMMQRMTEQLPALPLYHNYTAAAYSTDLVGPTPDGLNNWQIHNWSWR